MKKRKVCKGHLQNDVYLILSFISQLMCVFVYLFCDMAFPFLVTYFNRFKKEMMVQKMKQRMEMLQKHR